MIRIRALHVAVAGTLGLIALPIGQFDASLRDPAPAGRAQACAAIDTTVLRERHLTTRAAPYEAPSKPSNADRTYPPVDVGQCDLLADTGPPCSSGALDQLRVFVYVMRSSSDAEARFHRVRLLRVDDDRYRVLDDASPAYVDRRADGLDIAVSWSGRVIYGVEGRACPGADRGAIERDLRTVITTMQVGQMISA